MLIPNKYNGYSRDNRRLYFFDGGGSEQPAQTSQTQTTDLPDWAKPYAKDILSKGSALTDVNQNPYQTYGGERIAGFSDMQRNAMRDAGNMRTSSQLDLGTNLASAASMGALNTNYRPGEFSNQFQAPAAYQAGQFNPASVQARGLQQYQMGPAERVRTQSFTQPGSAEAYMSPYMQNVVGIQQREAQRQADIAGTQRGAQAVGAGAFGGSRQAIMEAEAARNLAQQKGDIQAQGLQSAFGQAQSQFNAEQQARLQAQLANQQAGLTVGGQNLGARLGVQQLGAGQDLQAQLANQQMGLNAQQMYEQSRQFGAGQGLQAAGLGAQYGQAAQQLGEQSRQYGAGLGMQGLQTAMQGANTLGQLGGQQFQQGMDINKLQSAYGGMDQAQRQQALDVGYQDFMNQQNYPYKQLGFMSDLLRGTPTGSSSVTQMYQPPGSTMGQVAGIGAGLYGLSKFMAEGGEVQSYDEGGVTSQGNVEAIIQKLSDQQLQAALQNAQARNDMATMQAIQQELAMRASEKQGMAGAFNMLPQESQDEVVQAAGGGIIAFADRGSVEDPDAVSPEDYQFIRPELSSAVSSGLESFKKAITPEAARLNREKYEAAVAAQKEAAAAQKEASKPAPVAKPQPKGAGARSTPEYVALDKAPAAPAAKSDLAKQYQDLSSIPKPPKEVVKSAVEQLAEKNDLSKSAADNVLDETDKILAKLDARNKPKKEAMDQLIESMKPNIEEMKKQGLGQALAEYGFKWAAEASKPGARFLGSAASASPALSSSLAKAQELQTTAQQNFAKLKMDQMKYEVALEKGDMQLAATLAGQIRQGQQADKTLQFQIAKAQDDAKMEERKLAQTGEYYRAIAGRQPENVMSLATQLMKDPAFKGTQNDAIEKAAYLLKGGVSAGIRGETASAANLDKALKDIAANYPLLRIIGPQDPNYAAMKAARDADVRAAYARHGGAGISDALPSSNANSMAAKGFKNLGAE